VKEAVVMDAPPGTNLNLRPNPSIVRRMRNVTKPQSRGRTKLGHYIVADPEICHGKRTFKGTRIMVRQVLDGLARGESADDIIEA
jgi:hypothetical protein